MAKNPTLDIDKTTIGYSKAGIDKLIAEVNTRIEDAYGKIEPTSKSNTAFVTLTQTLDNYWDGDDYDAFVATLQAAAQELANSLKQYKSTLTESLTSYKKQWVSFQSTTAGQIKQDLKIVK